VPAPTTPSSTSASRAAAASVETTPGAAPRAAHLRASSISKRYADRRVLTDVGFTARPGDRIGLIGENGSGKSTLLRIVGGLEPPDAGSVEHAGSVGSLEQELPYPGDAPIARVLDDAQREPMTARRDVEDAARALAGDPDGRTVAEAYAAALERAERLGAWQSESRRGDVTAGLGLGGIPASTPVGALSGGQRLRLALAALLLEAPHTILLDEPSNHLDDASVAYLERMLVDWPGIVIVASHDRALLDAVTTRILDLDPAPVPAAVLADAAEEDARAHGADAGADDAVDDDTGTGFGLRVWGTGYSAARQAQRAELARWRERYAAELAERDALLHEIEIGSREVNRKRESKSESRITRKFYADRDAKVTARRARNARVRLEQLERERVRRPPEPIRFSGIGSPVGSDAPRGTALRAAGLARDGRLRPTSFALPRGGRLMLSGPNGSGKSTLLAILAGDLAASEGSLEIADGLRVGYLPQEVAFRHPERTADEIYERLVGARLADERPLVAAGLLAARDVRRPVGALSVGQRRRLALATLIADPPPILLLDEPSNHLSLSLVEELEEALRSFAGALVIATHDRWLRSRWSGESLALVPAPG